MGNFAIFVCARCSRHRVGNMGNVRKTDERKHFRFGSRNQILQQSRMTSRFRISSKFMPFIRVNVRYCTGFAISVDEASASCAILR